MPAVAALRRVGGLRPHAEDLPLDATAPGRGLTIGVLALQGAFAEHRTALTRLGCEVQEVRRVDHLDGLDALVMPGGESTTMSKLLVSSGLFDSLNAKLIDGFPVFGTCAGLILLARDVADGRSDQRSFAALDVTVRRNGYGRQVDSFETDLDVADIDRPVHAVFIRAPKIEDVGPRAAVLSRHDGTPVLVRQGNVLGASFHPEMTPDISVHRLFVEAIVGAQMTCVSAAGSTNQ